MAYYTLHAYDADVWVPEFRGLRQSEEIASDLRYAMEAENVETPRGVLQPMASPEILDYTFDARIETLATFHRRWATGTKDWIIVAAGGKLFYMPDDGTEWEELGYPTGIEAWQSNVWSWVTYEINEINGVPTENPVDVLLMSNALDGMIMIVPGDEWTVEEVDTKGYKFGVIERYAERIWGGAITDDPDMLIYSAPFDPTNWEGNTEIPEDGAGSIQQPSWDGDSFKALKSFGSQLIALKKNRVWRILGTDPGEYTFKEQFGGGTAYANTVALDNEQILLLEKDGLSVYDGLAVNPFHRDMIERFWKEVNKSALDQACGVLFKKRYYLAVPTGTSAVNNALIVYNIEEGTFLLYREIYIESMMATEEKLYATSSTLPGKIMVINYDSWESGKAYNQSSKWVTPWMDFSRKSIAKGGYEIYFMPEVKGTEVTFRFSIQTEKKTKAKTIIISDTSEKAKQKRIRFGGTSRKFRLIVETVNVPENTVWRFVGGIQMVVETDPD